MSGLRGRARPGRRGAGHAARHQPRVADPGDLRAPGGTCGDARRRRNPNQIPSRFLYTERQGLLRRVPAYDVGGRDPALEAACVPATAGAQGTMCWSWRAGGAEHPARPWHARSDLGVVDRPDVCRTGVRPEVDDEPDPPPGDQRRDPDRQRLPAGGVDQPCPRDADTDRGPARPGFRAPHAASDGLASTAMSFAAAGSCRTWMGKTYDIHNSKKAIEAPYVVACRVRQHPGLHLEIRRLRGKKT